MAGNAALQNMNVIGFRESLRGVWLAIIDPAQRKMIRLDDIASG